MFVYADHAGMWRSELSEFVPDRIFDCHVHIGPTEAVGTISDERRKVALTTYTSLDWPQTQEVYDSLFPGRKVRCAAFGFPLRETDIRKANRYIIDESKAGGYCPMLLASPKDMNGLAEDCCYAMGLGVRIYGLKPYFEFACRTGSFGVLDVAPDEFIGGEMLAFMQEHKLALMLHTSKNGVCDQEIQGYISYILKVYPSIKLCLAHMGRFFRPEQYDEFFKTGFLQEHAEKNLWMDFSSVACTQVLELALSVKPMRKKLMFGTDMPYGLITGVERFSPTMGAVFLTRDEYPWCDGDMLDKMRDQRRTLTYNTYHCIQAFREALENAIPEAQREEVKRDVFYNNAERYFDGAA
jgi:hypothetical protein